MAESKTVKRYLDKVLVIASTNIYFLLDAGVVPNNQVSNTVSDAVVHDKSCCLVQVISDLVIAKAGEFHLLIRDAFNILLIFNRI